MLVNFAKNAIRDYTEAALAAFDAGKATIGALGDLFTHPSWDSCIKMGVAFLKMGKAYLKL